MRTPLYMLRFAPCCFLLFGVSINAKAQQAAVPSVNTGSSYLYSSRGIGFKQGNGGFDVFQVQGGDQIGVVKVGGGHMEFKKLGDVSPELEKTVMDAVHDYQMGRVSPATTFTPASKSVGAPVTGDSVQAGNGGTPPLFTASNGVSIMSWEFNTAKNATTITFKLPGTAGALGTPKLTYTTSVTTGQNFSRGGKAVFAHMAGQNLEGSGVSGTDVTLDVGYGSPMSTSMQGTGRTGLNERIVDTYLTAINEFVGSGKGSGNLRTPAELDKLYGVWGSKAPASAFAGRSGAEQ